MQAPQIPKQENDWDCGLFTLTYMEFFACYTPRQIHYIRGSKKATSLLTDFTGVRMPSIWGDEEAASSRTTSTCVLAQLDSLDACCNRCPHNCKCRWMTRHLRMCSAPV